jgi:hypothetical protein
MPLLLAAISSVHANVIFADLWNTGNKGIIFVILSVMIEFVCYYLLLHRSLLRTLLASIVINGISALIGFANKFLPIDLVDCVIGWVMGKTDWSSFIPFPFMCIIGFMLIIGVNTAIESVAALPFFGVKQCKNIAYAVFIANVLSVAVGLLGLYLIGR